MHARTAPWAQELSFLEEDLLRSVRAAVPNAGIERLRIRVGPLPPRRPRPPPPKKVDPIPLSALPPDVARGLAHVADEGLRDAMTKAARHALAPGPNRRPAGRRGRGR